MQMCMTSCRLLWQRTLYIFFICELRVEKILSRNITTVDIAPHLLRCYQLANATNKYYSFSIYMQHSGVSKARYDGAFAWTHGTKFPSVWPTVLPLGLGEWGAAGVQPGRRTAPRRPPTVPLLTKYVPVIIYGAYYIWG